MRNPSARGLPRSIEAPLAALFLLLSGPLILLAGLAVVLTSGTPAFFRQIRVGRNGESFVLIKLRTMAPPRLGGHGKPQPGAQPEVTAAGDARITAIGRLLRATKLDELPELWHVLVGEMSFVGPRPEVPRWVDLEDPLWIRVLAARPGLTDPVTLRLRNEEDLMGRVAPDEREAFYRQVLQPWKLRGYLDYLESRTAVSDLRVLGQTLLAILRPGDHPPPELDDLRSPGGKGQPAGKGPRNAPRS